MTQWIASRYFHLDHVGARVGQELRAVGTGDLSRAIDDANAIEHQRAPKAGHRRREVQGDSGTCMRN